MSEECRQAIVIDDEKVIAEDLANLISQRKGWNAAAATNLDDVLPRLLAGEYAVCFLDIEMPGKNGLTAGRIIKDQNPDIEIVFVTAFQQHAASAFRIDAVDYLIKPVTRDLLDEACLRIERRQKHQQQVNSVAEREAATNSKDDEARIKIQTAGRIQYLNTSSILYAKASGNYVDILTSEKTHRIRTRFTDIAAMFLKYGLIRIHRSYVVNPARVSSAAVSAKKIAQLYLDNGERLPVSENYRDDATALFSRIY